MRTQLSLVQAIGFCLVYVALGFLFPIFTLSPNPFEAAPFWIITSALSILLIGLVLGLLAGRFTPAIQAHTPSMAGIWRALTRAFPGRLPALPLQNALAHSFANGLGHRPRLWDTSMVKSFPKKLLKGDS